MDQEKLLKFRQAVFADVDQKVRKLEKEAEESKTSSLARTEEEQLSSAYAYIQDNVSKIQEEYRLLVAKAELDASHEILLRREDYRGRILDEIRKRIREFAQTDEYRSLIAEKLRGIVKERPLSGCEIRFMPADGWIREEVLSLAGSDAVSFREDPSIELGGFSVRIEEEGYLIDETFDSRLTEQLPYFNQKCRLAAD